MLADQVHYFQFVAIPNTPLEELYNYYLVSDEMASIVELYLTYSMGITERETSFLWFLYNYGWDLTSYLREMPKDKQSVEVLKIFLEENVCSHEEVTAAIQEYM